MLTAYQKLTFSRLAFIVLLPAFFLPPITVSGQESENPFEQTPINPDAGSVANGQSSQVSEANNAGLEIVARELGELIPSDGELDPAVVAKLKAIATAYTGSDMKIVGGLLDSLKADTANFPPVEIMIASLHFRASRNNLGFQALELAAKNSPNYPGVYFAFGRVALGQNRLTDAGALAEKAGRIFREGEYSEAEKNHFREHYFEIVTLVALRQERLEEAARLAESFEKVAPDNPKSLALSAEVFCNQGETEKSLAKLRRLRELQPNTRVPELIVAGWFRKLGRKDEAKRLMNQAAGQYPSEFDVQVEVADWAVTAEDFALALAAAEKAEKVKGEETQAIQWVRARIAFANGEYEVAERMCEQLFKSNNRAIGIVHQYALCLIESSDGEKKFRAQELATQILRQSPDNPLAMATLGRILYVRGETQNAEKLLLQAAQRKPLAAETAYYIASALADKGDEGAAVALLDKALKTEGYFMYRKRANELLNIVSKKIAEKSEPEQPKPTQ